MYATGLHQQQLPLPWLSSARLTRLASGQSSLCERALTLHNWPIHCARLGSPDRSRRSISTSSSPMRRRRADEWGPHHHHHHQQTPPAPLRDGPLSSSVAAHNKTTFNYNPTDNTRSSGPLQRLSLISRHLHQRPLLEINTPFSIERNSTPQDDIPYIPLTRDPPSPSQAIAAALPLASPDAQKQEQKANSSGTMSSQPEHPTLLIPGPIEFDDAVLQSMSHYSESHVGPGFVATFGEVLTLLRQLFQTTSAASQPFVISGSGTLGWDMVAANLAERGDEVLVLHTGYFADSFTDCFETYGVKATQLKAPIGSRPSMEEVETALKEKKYKLVTVTHVDTSTGVLSDIKAVAELVHRVSPETLVVVDGVCSVGCEEIAFDEWGLDVVLTASQKAIGCPAGLCIMMCSGKAIEVFEARKTPPSSYFASFKNWMPIMKNYEAKKPSYFATPSPQLIHALHTALTQIVSSPQHTTLGARFTAHSRASQHIKSHITQTLGLRQLASDPACQANGMTAVWLPEGLKPTDVLPKLAARGVVFAGGLHKEVATKYVRFGHMGVSVLDERRGDVDKALKALGEALEECGYKAPDGATTNGGSEASKEGKKEGAADGSLVT